MGFGRTTKTGAWFLAAPHRCLQGTSGLSRHFPASWTSTDRSCGHLFDPQRHSTRFSSTGGPALTTAETGALNVLMGLDWPKGTDNLLEPPWVAGPVQNWQGVSGVLRAECASLHTNHSRTETKLHPASICVKRKKNDKLRQEEENRAGGVRSRHVSLCGLWDFFGCGSQFLSIEGSEVAWQEYRTGHRFSTSMVFAPTGV